AAEEHASDGIIIRDTIQQVQRLLFLPNELSLELWNLYLAFLDIANDVPKERRFGFEPTAQICFCAHHYRTGIVEGTIRFCPGVLENYVFSHTSAPFFKNPVVFSCKPDSIASASVKPRSAADLRTSSVIFMQQKSAPYVEHQPTLKLRLDRKSAGAHI